MALSRETHHVPHWPLRPEGAVTEYSWMVQKVRSSAGSVHVRLKSPQRLLPDFAPAATYEDCPAWNSTSGSSALAGSEAIRNENSALG